MVIYTGQETKQQLNQGKYQNKLSIIDKLMNYFVIINFIIFILLDVLMSQLGTRLWLKYYGNLHFYIYPQPNSSPQMEAINLKSMASFYLILNNLIPLGL